jgi:YHS domain-containing protein
MRFLFLRVILPLLLFLLLRYVLKSIGESMKSGSPGQSRKQASGARAGGELKKDPVCGTFVSPETAVTRTVGGKVVHFCSESCSDRYRG